MIKPKLSIIVPIYNVCKYLDKCIESILNNDIEQVEIILIDDGSTDESAIICDKYKSIQQVHVIHQKNMGVSKARNVGIEMCTGEYIVFIDSDDYVSPIYVNTILKSIQSKKDIYFFGAKNIENKKITTNRKWIYTHDKISSKQDVYDIVLSGKSNEPWDKVFKKEIIVRYNIHFKENLSLGEDIIFTLDYLKYAKSGDIIKKDIYYYRILNTGLSRKKVDIGILDKRNILFVAIMGFIDSVKLQKEVIENAYDFMLQIIVNCCGKLSKNNYCNKEIERTLNKFDWCIKLEKHKYTSVKSCIRMILWKYKRYDLMALFFNKD